VGFDAIINTAKKFEIGTERPLGKYYPMAIGAYEQTVMDMAAAYAAVANRGIFVKPTPFEEIRGPEGKIFWSRRVDGDRGRRALDSDVADAMNWMFQRVVAGGTGIAAKLDDRQVAGKTGTSEGARDLWFIGSIPQLTTAVWFGYDDNRETKSNSGEAAWAWKQFMLRIKEELPVQAFPPKPELNRPWRVPGKKKPKKTDKTAAYLGYEHESESPTAEWGEVSPFGERPATGIQFPRDIAPPALVSSPNESQSPAPHTQRNWMKPRIQDRRWTR
jgi:penicillin-binding protein 1A